VSVVLHSFLHVMHTFSESRWISSHLGSRPSSQLSQSHLSGMHFSDPHFSTSQHRYTQLNNLSVRNLAGCKPQMPLTQPGSQATCNNTSLPTSMSQPQSQLLFSDPPFLPTMPPINDVNLTQSETPVMADSKLLNCRQMQLKAPSSAGLNGNLWGLQND
jgi:hypothetical protein